MIRAYPDYYYEFKCINKNCRHNCCIGWEIDIDSDTYGFYNGIKGDFGNRLKNNIDVTDTPHFILGEKERCPFLNKDNLCDIIITLGEDKICDICKEHPRFHNQLPTRLESGLGLCCEEAARIILGKNEPMKLMIEGQENGQDEIIALRDRVITLLQDRSKTVNERINDCYDFLKLNKNEIDFTKWIDILLSLERLDEKWTEILLILKKKLSSADIDDFKKHMNGRQTEYEQLLVYIIYRYFANSSDIEEAQTVVRFSEFVYSLIFNIGAATFRLNGAYTFYDQIEIVRMFSSEIEYSDENLSIVFEELENE